jgi:hypothetical protein
MSSVLSPHPTCLRVPRDLGPYSNDAEYIIALVASEREDMKLLLSPDAHSRSDFDKDLAEDAEEIIQALDELQPILSVLFPSQPRNFALHHRDLSLSNILVDPQHTRLRESSTGNVSVLGPTGKTRTQSSCLVQRLQKRLSHLPQEIRTNAGWSGGRTGKK